MRSCSKFCEHWFVSFSLSLELFHHVNSSVSFILAQILWNIASYQGKMSFLQISTIPMLPWANEGIDQIVKQTIIGCNSQKDRNDSSLTQACH